MVVNLHEKLSTTFSTCILKRLLWTIPEVLSLLNKFYASLKANNDLKNNITY